MQKARHHEGELVRDDIFKKLLVLNLGLIILRFRNRDLNTTKDWHAIWTLIRSGCLMAAVLTVVRKSLTLVNTYTGLGRFKTVDLRLDSRGKYEGDERAAASISWANCICGGPVIIDTSFSKLRRRIF